MQDFSTFSDTYEFSVEVLGKEWKEEYADLKSEAASALIDDLKELVSKKIIVDPIKKNPCNRKPSGYYVTLYHMTKF